ncbi:MAG: hypothetical protein A3K76_02770 [Euryarchaeota archaeon RBG_13_57_23]|nr:MAG: hypothetical protein A3K76_02770 [Euryarchaeota archaeon RBG_13_57_23]
MSGDLDKLFKPSSVAVIGASANPSKMSHIALRNLSSGAFSLYPVNPHEKELLGMRCYGSIMDVPGKVDLALVSLPASASLGPVRECVKKGVGVVVVTASGFKESGPEGARLEKELVDAVSGSGTRLLGPNTMGVFVPAHGLDTFFIPRERSPRPGRGNIAMLSQSGAVSISFLERAAASGMGVSACVGLGNKADINENDLLRYLGSDRSTGSIAMYLESFSDGKEFSKVAAKVTRKKPVVILKSGRTKSGILAASSHTGALASSSDTIVDSIMRQVGVMRAYDEEELADSARALAHVGHLRGDRICVVASAGGFGVIGIDLAESSDHGAGLKVAKLSEPTVASLRRVVPGFSSVSNPVDLTAGVTDAMYDEVLEILQHDPGVDGIFMSLELQPPGVTDALIGIAEKRSKPGGVPIVVSAFGGERTAEILVSFERKGVLAYPTIWRSIRALRVLAERGRYLKRTKTFSEDPR